MLNFDEWIITISAMIFFISIIGVFISEAKEKHTLTRRFGIPILALLIPMTFVFIYYLVIGQELKIYIFITLIFAYLIVELFLDFILKIEFREKTSTHVPYIILEYVACFSFIFLAFGINDIIGWVISICFWAMLVALIYFIVTKKKKERNY